MTARGCANVADCLLLLTKERDEALARIAELEQASLGEETSYAAMQLTLAEAQGRVAELERERDGWRADALREAGNVAYWRGQLAESQASAAAMRSALSRLVMFVEDNVSEDVYDDSLDAPLAALAPNAGCDLLAAVAVAREALVDLRPLRPAHYRERVVDAALARLDALTVGLPRRVAMSRESAIDSAAWIRITTAALARWRSVLADPDSGRARRSHAYDEYRSTILGAWDAYRPNGPLPGEVLPGEVERMQRELGEAEAGAPHGRDP